MLATSSGKDPPIVLLHCSLSSCCDVVTRGIAYDAGKIFLVTLDNHAVALDAKTGKEQWATQTGEINLGETTTAAPLVVKGKCLSASATESWGSAAASPFSTKASLFSPNRATSSPR
jgi:outer membrane protein assembly factor BamB